MAAAKKSLTSTLKPPRLGGPPKLPPRKVAADKWPEMPKPDYDDDDEDNDSGENIYDTQESYSKNATIARRVGEWVRLDNRIQTSTVDLTAICT